MNRNGAERKGRIPSLDGLRALSILGVLAGHALSPHNEVHPVRGMGIVLTYGSLGVRVFFAISGFLITTLLLQERTETGRIDLRGFYLRRMFRILPTYWLFLLAMAFFAPPAARPGIPTSFFFLSDYIAVKWPLGHTWSLSVEEQFYLVWPFILRVFGPRGGVPVAAGLWALALVMRVFFPHITAEAGFQYQCDALMAGCLLALWRDRHETGVLRLLGSPLVAWGSVLFLLVLSPSLAALLLHRNPLARYWSVAYSVETLAIASVLLHALRFPAGGLGRVLNARPMVHLGLISYSLYLWQQPFLLHAIEGAGWGRVALHLGLVFLIAEASYRFVETPFISLGRRLRSRWLAARSTAAIPSA